MDLRKAAEISQVLSFLPACYCAYGTWFILHPGAPVNSLAINATGILVAFILFISLAACGVVLSAISRQKASVHNVKWNTLIETISHHTFFNATVEIDGKAFDRCTFENVTLIYRGNAGFSLIDCIFKGSIRAQSENRAANAYATLLDSLRNLPHIKSFQFSEIDDSGRMYVRSEIAKLELPTKEEGDK